MLARAPEWLDDVPGASALLEWFGYWPDFHDSEVLSIHLDRSGSSSIRVHAFDTTGEVDEKGFFVTRKHVVVSFMLEEIVTCRLDGFNDQNAMSEIGLVRAEKDFELVLGPSYGVGGAFRAQKIRIEIEPGIPVNSQYRTDKTKC